MYVWQIMASGSCEGDDATVDIMLTSSSPQDDSLTDVTTSVSSDIRRICAVCGDIATGKHYGVYR